MREVAREVVAPRNEGAGRRAPAREQDVAAVQPHAVQRHRGRRRRLVHPGQERGQGVVGDLEEHLLERGATAIERAVQRVASRPGLHVPGLALVLHQPPQPRNPAREPRRLGRARRHERRQLEDRALRHPERLVRRLSGCAFERLEPAVEARTRRLDARRERPAVAGAGRLEVGLQPLPEGVLPPDEGRSGPGRRLGAAELGDEERSERHGEEPREDEAQGATKGASHGAHSSGTWPRGRVQSWTSPVARLGAYEVRRSFDLQGATTRSTAHRRGE